jgi:hypothetical protein
MGTAETIVLFFYLEFDRRHPPTTVPFQTEGLGNETATRSRVVRRRTRPNALRWHPEVITLKRKTPHPKTRRLLRNNPLAVTYFPTPLQVQYRERYDVSLPCSGWERVGPSCSYHQEKDIC